jgi:protein-disulfide isomerase
MKKPIVTSLTAILIATSLVACGQQTDSNPSSSQATASSQFTPQAEREVITAKQVANETLVRPHSPIIGKTDAPVTIVEFFDPSCEACRAMSPFVQQIMNEQNGKVRLVLRYTLFHKGSEQVARILETAREQGVFKPVLDAVFESQPQWHDDETVKAAWSAAVKAGLDEQKARTGMNSDKINQVLKQDMDDAKAIKITGTPTYFVNGKLLTNLSPEDLQVMVANEVKSTDKP